MKNLVHILCYLIDLYIYYVVICGFLTFVPNLNWDFPAIKMMFSLEGFNILSSVPLLNMFMPLILIVSLIAVRKLLYRLVGEDDKFLGYDVTNKNEDKDDDLNNEDLNNDNENSDSSDADN